VADLIMPRKAGAGGRGEDRPGPKQAAAWGSAAVAGTAFSAAAGADIALRLYPFGFGEPLWEATTMIVALDRMPLVLLGIGLLLGAAIAQSRRIGLFALAAVTVLFAIATGFAAFLLATAVPRVFASGAEAQVLAGLRRNTTRAAFEAAVCVLGALWIAWRGWQQYQKL